MCFTVSPRASLANILFLIKLSILYSHSLKCHPYAMFVLSPKEIFFFFFLETYLVLMNSDAYPHIYLLDSWIFRRFPFFFSGKWISGLSFLLLRNWLFVQVWAQFHLLFFSALTSYPWYLVKKKKKCLFLPWTYGAFASS